MCEWDTTWNCQSGRLTNEDSSSPWLDALLDDDIKISPSKPAYKPPVPVLVMPDDTETEIST